MFFHLLRELFFSFGKVSLFSSHKFYTFSAKWMNQPIYIYNDFLFQTQRDIEMNKTSSLFFWRIERHHQQTNKKGDIEFLCRELELYDRDIGRLGASHVALVVKNPPANAGEVRDAGLILGSGRSPGGGHGTHSSILAWRIPWTEESGGLQSIVLQRVGHN